MPTTTRARRRPSPFSRRLAGGSAVLAAALVMSACSGGNGGSGDGQQDSAAVEAATARVTQRLEQASQPVTYSGPEEPLNAAAVKGKSVCIIAVDTANQFVADISNHAAEAFKFMGIEA